MRAGHPVGRPVSLKSTAAKRGLLAAVVFAFWGGSLAVGFFLDDVHNLGSAVAAGIRPHALVHGFTVFDPRSAQIWCLSRHALHFFRPLFLLSLGLDHLLWGTHAFGYHLTNLALQVANVWMVHALLLRLKLPPPRALLAATLFAAFAQQGVAVVWISGRTELLLGTFVLAASILHARAIVERSRVAMVLSLVAAILALMTKENAVALPGYLILVEWALRPGGVPLRQAMRDAAKRLVPATAIVLAFLAWRLLAFRQVGMPPPPYFVSPANPAFPSFIAAKTVYYWFSWLTTFPVLPIAPVAFLRSHLVVAVVLTLVTAGGWMLIARRLRAAPSVGPLFGWAAASLVPVAMVMASSHYLYLGNVAIAAIWALALPLRGWRGRMALAATALVFAAQAAWNTVSYYRLSAQERAFAQAVRRVAPQVMRPGSELYLVNLPLMAAHTGERLRVLDGARDLRPHVLTVSSDPFKVGPAPVAHWTDARTLVLDLPHGLLPPPMGPVYRLMGVRADPGRTYPSGRAVVRPRAGPNGVIDRLVVRFADEAASRRADIVLFRAKGAEVEAERLAPAGGPTAVFEP